MVVFKKSNGEYVADRVYQRGKENDESISPKLFLDGGVAYTFIAYSVNSAVRNDLPALGGPASGKTISNSFVSVSSASSDLLFFKKDHTITGEAVDYLSVVFKHQFSQVTVVIDSKSTGYNVTSVSSKLVARKPQVQLNFSNGGIVRSGTTGDVPLVFTGYGTDVATSSPVTVNSSNISGSERFLSITSLVIGDVTVNSLSAFSNVQLAAGTKYKAKLTLVPNDKLMDNYGGFGFDAVRINGQVWMRHNLRNDGNYTADPDVAGADIFGDYYQWGRNYPVSSNERVIVTTPPNQWTTVANTYERSWNGNTSTSVAAREANPVKAGVTSGSYGQTGDPCPNGYRIPTGREMQALANYPDKKIEYTKAASTTNGVGRVVSKRNAEAKLTFPAQGTLFAVDGNNNYEIVSRLGERARVWSSYSEFTVTNAYRVGHLNLFMEITPTLFEFGIRDSQSNNTSVGVPIRCIAINSTLPQ